MHLFHAGYFLSPTVKKDLFEKYCENRGCSKSQCYNCTSCFSIFAIFLGAKRMFARSEARWGPAAEGIIIIVNGTFHTK